MGDIKQIGTADLVGAENMGVGDNGGGFGGLAGWLLVSLAGWTGTPGAIVAIVVGMVVATAIWVGLTSAVRSLRRPR